MRFDTTIDFGRSLAWWPLRTVLAAHKTGGVAKVLGIWGAATVVSVALALVEASRNWSGIPMAG